VIEAAKAAGIRPSTLGYAEINRAAIAYCEAHRAEMIAKALQAIQESPRLRQLAEMERRRRAKLRGVDLIGFLLCRYREQNGEPEMIVGYARVSTDGSHWTFGQGCRVSGPEPTGRRWRELLKPLAPATCC
jgi:hypothetical protein